MVKLPRRTSGDELSSVGFVMKRHSCVNWLCVAPYLHCHCWTPACHGGDTDCKYTAEWGRLLGGGGGMGHGPGEEGESSEGWFVGCLVVIVVIPFGL